MYVCFCVLWAMLPESNKMMMMMMIIIIIAISLSLHGE